MQAYTRPAPTEGGFGLPLFVFTSRNFSYNHSMNYYVYYSYEVGVDNPRGYIGRRQCSCSPEEDVEYFGSFKDKTFCPAKKIIIKTFDTVEEAIRSEIHLHWLFNVNKEPHFANRAKQTSTKFDTSGMHLSEEARKKLSNAMAGDRHPNFGKQRTEKTRRKISDSHKGKVFSEETRKKISDARKGKKASEQTRKKQSEVRKGERRTKETKRRISESLKGDKNPCFGKKFWVNISGELRLSEESPGPGWQNGRKWKEPGKTS